MKSGQKALVLSSQASLTECDGAILSDCFISHALIGKGKLERGISNEMRDCGREQNKAAEIMKKNKPKQGFELISVILTVRIC